jgi:Ni/Fe-hydrogenase subunit HybB-like protein
MEILAEFIPLLIPLIIIELGLMVYSLVDLIRRDLSDIKGGNKVLWGVVIIFVQLFGPLAYLLFGRKNYING